MPVIPESDANENNKFNLSFAVAIYSLCYAVMVPCSYWNTNAVATIAENGIKLYRLLSNRKETLDCLKKIVNIYEAEICVNLLNASSRGVFLSASRQCTSVLEDIIINNSECTGFCCGLVIIVSAVFQEPQGDQSICIP